MKTFEEYYLAKDYPNALLTLEKNQREFDAGLWHYNKGTILAEMKNWPLARFHFILAEAKGLDSNELIQNQKLVEDKLEIGRLEKPLSTTDFLIKGGMIASQGPLLSISLLFLLIGLWFIKKIPSWKSALIFVTMISIPLIVDFWIDSWPRKIVLIAKPIHEGPSVLFGVKGELPSGVLVVTNVKGEWEEVVYPSRFSGWIKSDGLKIVEFK